MLLLPFMGRYQEAVPFLERYVANYPNLLYAHIWLAVAYSELGRDEQASAEAAEVLRLSPQYKLPTPEKAPMKDARRFFADLRKAGLK
jgi:adenylate cyclase